MALAFCCTISVLISDHDEIYELRMKHVFLSLFPQKIFQQKFCHKPWGRGPCNILSRFVQTGGTETFPFFMSTLSTSTEKSGYLKNLNIYHVLLFVYNWMKQHIYGILVFPDTSLTLWRHIFLARVSNMVAQHCMSICWLHHCEDDHWPLTRYIIVKLTRSDCKRLLHFSKQWHRNTVAILRDNAIASLRAVNTHGFPIKTHPAVRQAQNISNSRRHNTLVDTKNDVWGSENTPLNTKGLPELKGPTAI